jgi:2-dehydropantoate 2-reductase
MLRKYGKLLLNLANVLEAACGMRDGAVGDIYQRARAEALACYEAAGIDAPTDDDAERRKGMKMAPIDGVRRDGGSTWQSLARSAPTIETDYLNGEIVLLGRTHGVPTPVNEALQRLGRRLVADHVAPGTFPLDELLAVLP